MTTLEQVQDNVASMDPFIPLSTTEQDTLARALDVFKAQKLAPLHGLQVLHAPAPPGSTFRACCTPGTNTACVVTASPP